MFYVTILKRLKSYCSLLNCEVVRLGFNVNEYISTLQQDLINAKTELLLKRVYVMILC